MEYFRHGDVIIIKFDKTREDLEKGWQKQPDLILAKGEVSGHTHRISDGVAGLFKFDNKTYLRVQSDIATLSHEEHKKIALSKGDYEIIIQREYKPEGWTYVAD